MVNTATEAKFLSKYTTVVFKITPKKSKKLFSYNEETSIVKVRKPDQV